MRLGEGKIRYRYDYKLQRWMLCPIYYKKLPVSQNPTFGHNYFQQNSLGGLNYFPLVGHL